MTHYDVLGVASTASIDEIKQSYHRWARAYHPDAHAGSSPAVLTEAERAMAGVNAAWNVLRDPRLRKKYDDSLAATVDVPAKRARQKPRSVKESPALVLGSGFRLWMGACGVVRTGPRPRFSLAVDRSTTDLAPLRAFAPDRLVALHAAGSAIDDAQLANLHGMSGLQQLDLARTRVTDAGLLHLQGLDSLEVLDLWDTTITDAGLAVIGRLRSLRHLGLGGTAVTDPGLASLAELTSLRVLQLSGTRISGRGLKHLEALADLEVLSLPWTVRRRERRRLGTALTRTSLR